MRLEGNISRFYIPYTLCMKYITRGVVKLITRCQRTVEKGWIGWRLAQEHICFQ